MSQDRGQCLAFVNTVWNLLGFHARRERKSLITEPLLAFYEGTCFMELLINVILSFIRGAFKF